MSAWADVLNTPQAGGIGGDVDGPGRVEGGNPADDGFLMTSGLKNAAKCRDCSKTVDIGLPAWFNKDGEPGRKVTCQECHQSKYGDTPPPDASKDADDVKTKPKKIRKLAPKFEHHMLLDHKKGLVSVFKTFPKYKFKGKGHEASDLRRLLGKYAEWAHILIPDMGFSDFVQKVEKGNNRRSQEKVEQIRNVVQGLMTVQDIEEYDLDGRDDRRGPGGVKDVNSWMEDAEGAMGAGAVDPFAVDGEWANGDWGDDDDEFNEMMGAPAAGSKPAGGAAGGMTAEQRERMERNKRLALEKAAARKAAAGGGHGAPTEEEEDMEMEWAAAQAAPPPAARRVVDDDIDAFDEEAEMDFFPMARPPPSAARVPQHPPPPAAAHAPLPFDEFDDEEAEIEAEIEAAAHSKSVQPAASAGDAPPSQPFDDDAFTLHEPPTSASAPSQTYGASDFTYREPEADAAADTVAADTEVTEAAQAEARAAAQAQAAALEAGLDDDDDF